MNEVGVSQKALIFYKEKFLVLKRGETAPSNPNKWDFPGGDMDFGENAYDSIKREIKEESGLNINELEPYDVYSKINNINNFWVTIAYKGETDNDNVQLSYEHSDYKWVDLKEFNQLDVVEKIKIFVRKYYDQ